MLAVDDDELLRGLLREYLEAAGGCLVVGEAGDGHDAIMQAGELQPDVVVLDITMPRLDGLSALPDIRRAAPRARILMHSGCDGEDRHVAFERGAHAFCTKGESLRQVVREVLLLAGGPATASP